MSVCAVPLRNMLIDAVMRERRSVRAFLPTPVSQEAVAQILSVAASAPSGTNTQPWKVYVLTGAAREALSRDILDAFDQPDWAQTHREVSLPLLPEIATTPESRRAMFRVVSSDPQG